MVGAGCELVGRELLDAPMDDPPPHPVAAIRTVNKNGNADMREGIRIRFSFLLGSRRSGRFKAVPSSLSSYPLARKDLLEVNTRKYMAVPEPGTKRTHLIAITRCSKASGRCASHSQHPPSQGNAVGGEVQRRQNSDVHGKHAAEQTRVGIEGAHYPLA